jgi:hypothetical protein
MSPREAKRHSTEKRWLSVAECVGFGLGFWRVKYLNYSRYWARILHNETIIYVTYYKSVHLHRKKTESLQWLQDRMELFLGCIRSAVAQTNTQQLFYYLICSMAAVVILQIPHCSQYRIEFFSSTLWHHKNGKCKHTIGRGLSSVTKLQTVDLKLEYRKRQQRRT